MLECAGSLFTVKGAVTKSAGWRAVFGEKEDGEDNTALPAMQDGDSLQLSGIELLEKPVSYTHLDVYKRQSVGDKYFHKG